MPKFDHIYTNSCKIIKTEIYYSDPRYEIVWPIDITYKVWDSPQPGLFLWTQVASPGYTAVKWGGN